MSDSERKPESTFEPPAKVTEPSLDYFRASFRNFGLLGFLADSVALGDYVAHRIRAVLNEQLKDDIDVVSLAKKSPGPRTRQLRKYGQELFEAFLVRFVDNFQTYLAAILRDVLRTTPEMLKSRQQTVTLEYLLQFASMEDLQLDLVESRVNSLSYKGFEELEKWFSEKGIPLEVASEREG